MPLSHTGPFTMGEGHRQAAPPERPNFVFIYTDDQRWDALGVVQREQKEKARFPWFQTPNLDRLAAGGVRFRNAFVVSSLCAPSRAAFLTGRYNHENGVANNHTPFPVNSVTHATLLRAAGYATGYIGKWHMGNQRERPGFDYAASFVGQGRYNDCTFVVDGKDTPTTGWVDDVSTDFAIDFLKRNQKKPFSLVLGYKSSHGPWEPPERARGRFENDVSRPVPNLSATAAYRGGTTPVPRGNPPAQTADRMRMQRNYFRTLSAVDDNVGRLLRALDDLGLAQNTVVVYSSDNGYYLGEHGLGDKRSAYDEALRVPMLVRYPKMARAGRTEDDMVLNIDLAPTLLELAGLPVPAAMQGRSLRPHLQGVLPARPREAFFYEYFYERGFATPTVLAVRTTDAKLIKYPGHDEWTELFDLKADPYETRNLFADPAHKSLREKMLAAFDREAKAVNFHIPAFADRPGASADGRTSARIRDRELLRFEAVVSGAARVEDRSGAGNHGAVSGGVGVAPGQRGKPALRFDGKGHISVARSAALDPSGGAWTVEVTLNPEKPDGIILAHGGRSHGYALYLEDGTPCFAVTADQRATVVRGSRLPMKQWLRIRGVITKDRRARLFVDNKEVGAAPLPAFIPQNPNDVLQIGTDLQTTVAPYRRPDNFTGLIESVRIYGGEEKS